MFTPTVLDPAVALMQNRDWTGCTIYREDMNSLEPTPGHTRAKDTASIVSKAVAEAMNSATGGNDYRPGLVSWTPDQIDYVVGQLTGGVGRELLKVEQTITALFPGEDLPPHKVPVLGRLYGNTRGASGNSDKFYDNIRTVNMVEAEVKGRARAGDDADGFIEREPLVELVGAGNAAEKHIRELRKHRRQIIAEGLPGFRDEARGINEQIGEVMTDFNRQVREAKRASQ